MDSSRRAFLCFLIYTTGVLFTAGGEVVQEGNTVTIHTGLTGVQSDALILWFYRSEKTDIKIVNSQIIRGEDITDYYTDRFRDRLQLDRSSGSLTIRNISREDSGVYLLEITTGTQSLWRFSVKVYAPVSKPVIRTQAERSSSLPRGSCSPVCSVENGEDVSLSWYEDKERISTISTADSSDSSLHLHLPLNRTFPNCYTYTCVSDNPISHQSTQLNIAELCDFTFYTGRSSVHCCSSVEMMVRLVFSALVGVATVAILLYHFTSRTGSD